MRSLYKLATASYSRMVKSVSPFNDKAKKWVDGRKQSLDFLCNNKINGRVIWFHVASLGEFEQGKPVMEAFKKQNPDWKLVITFFSPSGYDVRHDYYLAEKVLYLPIENKKNISLFLGAINPEIAVFVKYEFWFGYMSRLYQRSIPLVFISASFRPQQVFFKWYGPWFLEQLRPVNVFFVQEESSKVLLTSNQIKQVKVSGDTRFDRVFETFEKSETMPDLEVFKSNCKILIFGSAWAVETEASKKVISQLPEGWRVILAPHEIDAEVIDRYRKELKVASVLYSEFTMEKGRNSQVLIVDTIGHLARMYKYADVAIIGGGFMDGIHNILEPLVFGCPVFFGPNHFKFWEGKAVISQKIGFEFRNESELIEKLMPIVKNEERLDQLRINCHAFIKNGKGATSMISEHLNILVK
ncbi:MAG: 3-deoxy-D-manno-octulosonic-acid transferase [Salibacteraceae bacterium]|jgi:3-deoxy-D-manno-octulosonic-acid transferase